MGVCVDGPEDPLKAITSAFPSFIEPALATSIDKVPRGERWLREIRDGYRVQVHLRDAAVKVFTRRGNDWTNRFRKIAADAWHVNAGSAIIDGEAVVPAVNGTTDFSVLQNELKGRSKKIVMVAFDLLYLNGHDLRKLPLFERKALLKKIIDKTDIQFSESFDVDRPALRDDGAWWRLIQHIRQHKLVPSMRAEFNPDRSRVPRPARHVHALSVLSFRARRSAGARWSAMALVSSAPKRKI